MPSAPAAHRLLPLLSVSSGDRSLGNMDQRQDQQHQEELRNIEKEEEAKLKQKYPAVTRPGPGFLQKRLQKGQKYFDSGDYNMAKAAVGKGRLPVSALSQQPPPAPVPPSTSPVSTGDTIPTPDCLATRKTSIHVQSKLATGTS